MKKINLLISLFCLTFLWACETGEESVEPEIKKEVEQKIEEPKKEIVPEGLVFDPNNIATYGLATMRLKGTSMFPDLEITYDELSGRINNVKNKGKGISSIRESDGTYTTKKYDYSKETRFSYKNWQLKQTTIIVTKTFEDLTVENDSITEEFWYDLNNNPTSIVVNYHNKKIRGVYNFSYLGGRVTDITQHNQKLSFEWDEKNITKATRIYPDGSKTVIATFNNGYDQNKNIDGIITNIALRPFSIGVTNVCSYFSENNPKQFGFYFAGENYSIQYEYNSLDSGLITKREYGSNSEAFTWEQNPFLLEE